MAGNWSEATQSTLSHLVVCQANSVDLGPVTYGQIEVALPSSSAIFTIRKTLCLLTYI